jgi:Homeodomain-like domain
MSETNGNGDRPRRRRRRKGRVSEGALPVRQAKQIAAIVERAENRQRAEAVAMRLNGKTYHEIAQTLEVSVQVASRWVNGALRQTVEIDADKLEEQRQLEIDRLERLWSVWFPRATRDQEGETPNMAAASLCLKIAKRRAELVGLDREQKVATNVSINVGAEQLRQVVEAAQDPEAAAALERVAALFAHGEEALEGEWEDLDAGVGDGGAEAEDQGDPEDRPDHHITG